LASDDAEHGSRAGRLGCPVEAGVEPFEERLKIIVREQTSQAHVAHVGLQ